MMSRRAGEFDLIERLFAPLATSKGAYGLTNDGCVMAPSRGHEIAISTDTLIEGVHYLENTPPELIAAKLIGVNLSDLAAMGAKPLGYLLNCSFSDQQDDDWVQKFTEALSVLQDQYQFSLFGGDTTKIASGCVLSLTAFGEVKKGKSLVRHQAQAGDLICVSGTIGDGALGLLAAQKKIVDLDGHLADRYHTPRARVKLGQVLAKFCTTCLDISDGLGADLAHLCQQSQLGAQVFIEKIPLSRAATNALEKDSSLISTIISGGDDYELLFALPEKLREKLSDLRDQGDVEVTEIGVFTEASSLEFQNHDGQPLTLSSFGYRHF